jgi:hypothetical protein
MGTVASLKKLPKSPTIKDPEEGSFQAVVESLDDASKQIAYLMLGATEVIPDFNVKKTHPYSYFFYKKKGYKQVFQANKNLIVQEIKRRQPDAKPNQNNRSNDELLEMLTERWPLSGRDKAYVIETEKEYRKVLLGALNPKDVINIDELEKMASPGSSRKRPADDTASPSESPAASISNNKRMAAEPTFISAPPASITGERPVDNVTTMELIGKVAYGNLADVVEKLKKERFDLTVQKEIHLTKSDDAEHIELIDGRIKELAESIKLYEEKMVEEV